MIPVTHEPHAYTEPDQLVRYFYTLTSGKLQPEGPKMAP